MRYILVTGAYGGMGSAAVKVFRSLGYCVFAMDKNVREAEENIVPIRADITSEDSLREAVDTIKAYTDNLYAIVHYAGVYMLDSLVEMESDRFRGIFDVNVFGAFLVNKIFLPLLGEGSRIVITTSELAPLDPLPFTGVYAVTKGALDKYAYYQCMELQLMGIYVSVLRAGAVDTGMLGASTDALDRFCENTALYTCNADRFKMIVNSVESRCVSPELIAKKTVRILTRRKPSFAYSINRNPLLLLLNVLPKRLQLWVIKLILK